MAALEEGRADNRLPTKDSVPAADREACLELPLDTPERRTQDWAKAVARVRALEVVPALSLPEPAGAVD